MRMMNKYRNVKTKVDGIKFASKKEAQRYRNLKLLERSGYITNLEIQPPFEVKVEGKKICNYKADFSYLDKNGKLIVEDVKSAHTAKLPVYRLKKKLVEAIYKIEITEI